MATPWCCVPGYPCRTYPDTVIPGLMALGQVCLRLAGLDSLGASQGGRAPEHDEIDQRVGAEPVGTVNGDAGCLAKGHQAGNDGVRVTILKRQHLAVIVGRYAAHAVVHGRDDRYRLPQDIDVGEYSALVERLRQALAQHRRIEVREVDVHVVLVGTAAAPLPYFLDHAPGDVVARREILLMRRIPLHKALALRVGQVGAFPSRALGHKDARA
jgi:hypothetical protein